MELWNVKPKTTTMDSAVLSGTANVFTRINCVHNSNSRCLIFCTPMESSVEGPIYKDTRQYLYRISCLCSQSDSNSQHYETATCKFADHQVSSLIISISRPVNCKSEFKMKDNRECVCIQSSSPKASKISEKTNTLLFRSCVLSNCFFNHHRKTNSTPIQKASEWLEYSPLKMFRTLSENRTTKTDTKLRTNLRNSISGSTLLLSFRIAYLLFLIFLACEPTVTLGEQTKVSIHAIIPRHFGMTSELNREFSSTVVNFKRDIRNSRLKTYFSTEEVITFINEDTPREILDAFCKGVLAKHAVTILNINNPLGMKRRTSSNQYILEIANHLGIPVISWDTEFTGSSTTHRVLQLAPTLEHQAMAMASLLERYNWTSFTVVTSQVAGDVQFVAALENLVDISNNKKTVPSTDEATRDSLKILSTIHIKDLSDVGSELKKAVGSDTRVFLLHCSSRASYDIVEAAVKLGLTGKEYIWILTTSSIPTGKQGTKSFPVGLMGISFEYDLEAMKRVVRSGVKMWLYALLEMSYRPVEFANKTIPPQFSCELDADPYWKDGEILYRHMQNVSIRDEPHIEFNENGTLRRTEVIIVNLQWRDGQREVTEWKEVGRWKRHGLHMQDITWPGESSMPPTGKPRRAFLRVATLNELPYVIYRLPKEDGLCEENSLPCQVYLRDEKKEKLSNATVLRCCVGFSMDLLKILSNQLNFDYELKEVDDGKWGGINKVTKQWNGLVKVLLDDQADIVITSLKINPERAEAVRFSVPYLETGIKIIVALRDGAISPTAFLEPYDYASWSLILIFSVHATGSSILIFEWLSPYGLNRGKSSKRDHKFSLFRSFWLIWAMLFSTSVQTDSPKGIASKFLANIWALFALVFLASYTANLAAFMITKEVYYDLSGIQDYRLKNPYTMKPPFKYATIPNGSTEANIRANHFDMFTYMTPFNLPDVDAGIAALKQGKIQAFIYDSSVLEYYASRDPQCRLVTVGNRYAMTGYGVGFQPDFNNPWIDKINKVILKLQETGELDRMQKFWLAGACNTNKEAGVSNRTLGIINFTSAFILLGSGVLLGMLILCFEHMYFHFGRKYVRKWDKCGCCSLVSLSMGKSLRLKNYVDDQMLDQAKNRCKNAYCETQIWKLKHQLDMAILKIDNLEIQLSGREDSTLKILPLSDIENNTSNHHMIPNSIYSGANSIGHVIQTSEHDTAGLREQKSASTMPNMLYSETKASHHRNSDLTRPPLNRMAELGENSLCNSEDRFDSTDTSPFTENFPDPLLPPPHLGETPLLRDNGRGGSYEMGGFSEAGCETYVGFDDFSSDACSTQSSSALMGPDGAAFTSSSSSHMLRRTPSYTSAIGSNMNTDLTDEASPVRTGRVRQFDGKMYIGVDNSSPPT